MFNPISTVITSSLENKTPNPTIDFNFNFKEILPLYYYHVYISKMHESKQPTAPLNLKYSTNIVSFRFALFFIAASSDPERDVDNTRRPLFKRVKCKLHVTPAFS